MSLIQLLGRRLYHPSHHLWYRAVEHSTPSTTRRRKLEIGMTSRGLEDLGDISRVACLKKVGETVSSGDGILALDWEGHVITSADELYHTVWEPVEGRFVVEAPVGGGVEYVIGEKDVRGEDGVLVAMSADEKAVEGLLDELVTKDDYLRSIEEPGAFDKTQGYR